MTMGPELKLEPLCCAASRFQKETGTAMFPSTPQSPCERVTWKLVELICLSEVQRKAMDMSRLVLSPYSETKEIVRGRDRWRRIKENKITPPPQHCTWTHQKS